MIRIGSLFSGYGGLDLAVQQVLGGEVAWHVEYDKAPSRILDHHFPGVPNYGDVTKLDFRSVEPVDVLTGGYPCQPFSHAGLRKGTDDDRHLWPHVLRAICEMGPRLAILENVRGHLSLGFDSVLADLADVGWSARWGVVRASDAGAPHQRARLFIIAYASSRPLARPAEQHDRLRLTRERSGVASANPTGNGRTQGRAGSSQWPGSSRQLASNLSSIADAARPERRGAQQQHLGATTQPAAKLGKCSGPTADTDLAGSQGRQSAGRRDLSTWGDYGPAIQRWERVIGRPAPAPTESGRSGAARLSPAFVEWMMGLPAGWVTDPAIGISRNDQLKALGNGVVPQQAALALDVLLQGASDDLTQSFATV